MISLLLTVTVLLYPIIDLLLSIINCTLFSISTITKTMYGYCHPYIAGIQQVWGSHCDGFLVYLIAALHTKSTKMPVQTEPTVICSHHKGSSTDSITNVPFHSSLPTSTLSPCTSSSFASTSTSSPGSESAYEWPVIAMSMFTVIASAVLIVTIVVFALLCKKKRQQGYHTL